MAKPPTERYSRCYKKLSSYCHRLTKARTAILGVMSHCKKHCTADRIHKAVAAELPGVGLATVYRNLELLVRLGLVWKFDTGNGATLYEVAECAEERGHHHLICKKCHTIIDYSGAVEKEKEFIRQRERSLSKRYGFKIENHCIDFYGLCAKCRRG